MDIIIKKYKINDSIEFEKDILKFYNRRTEDLIQKTVDSLYDRLKILLEKSTEKTFASALAKEYAEKNSIDTTNIKGTGRNGMITKKDLQNAKLNHPCKGVKANGDPCTRNGVREEDGEWFCSLHS